MNNLKYRMITYTRHGDRNQSEYRNDFYEILQLYVQAAKHSDFPTPTLWVYDGKRYVRVHDFCYKELNPETYYKYLSERIIEDDEILSTITDHISVPIKREEH